VDRVDFTLPTGRSASSSRNYRGRGWGVGSYAQPAMLLFITSLLSLSDSQGHSGSYRGETQLGGRSCVTSRGCGWGWQWVWGC